MHLGLVDLSQNPIGTFFFGRSTLPRKWGTDIDKIVSCRLCVIWPQPKARETFIRKFGVRERNFCTSPVPGYLCGPCFKVIARTDHGNPAVLFPQIFKRHLVNWHTPAPASKMQMRPSSFGLCAVSHTSRTRLCLAGLLAYAKRNFPGRASYGPFSKILA